MKLTPTDNGLVQINGQGACYREVKPGEYRYAGPAPRPVLMEGNADITLAALLASVRCLPVALAQYIRDSDESPEGKARVAIAFRLYHAMPVARQMVCLDRL